MTADSCVSLVDSKTISVFITSNWEDESTTLNWWCTVPYNPLVSMVTERLADCYVYSVTGRLAALRVYSDTSSPSLWARLSPRSQSLQLLTRWGSIWLVSLCVVIIVSQLWLCVLKLNCKNFLLIDFVTIFTTAKNVASDIAEKLCDSVATKLEGKVISTFSGESAYTCLWSSQLEVTWPKVTSPTNESLCSL